MLGCPIVGYMTAKRVVAEETSEWADRVSDHAVYKSHILCDALARARPIDLFVYVVRDPRDVICSGAHYFDLGHYHERFGPGADRYEAMSLTLLRGGVYGGCQKLWREHVNQPFPANLCMVRYEDLVTRPTIEMRRIADAIGGDIAPGRIESAVARQSFAVRRAADLEAGDPDRLALLRKGVPGAHRDELPAALKAMVEAELGPELRHFGYLESR
jgi:hypothetical protein